MAIFNKPNFNSVWASTGVKVEPASAKVAQGWIVEIPPYEYDNWIINRQDSMLTHINQMGIAVWDNITEYQGGKSYVQGPTSGTIFRAVSTNSNINPDLDINGIWTVAFQSSGTALLKAQNLADVPDKALARANLGIPTTADYDLRYLIKSQNFADVPNKATARNNLDVYSKTETYTRTEVDNLSPAGMVQYFATATAPAGWLVMDGSAVSRTTYARLFAAIGTMYGAGNGSTTFNLPEARGEFIRNADVGRGVDPGRAVGSTQSSQNLAHNHTATTASDGDHLHTVSLTTNTAGNHSHFVNDPGHSHNTQYGDFTPSGIDTTNPTGTEIANWGGTRVFPTTHNGTGISLSNSGNHNHTVAGNTASGGVHTHAVTVDNSGGSESRPRNIAFLACIKF